LSSPRAKTGPAVRRAAVLAWLVVQWARCIPIGGRTPTYAAPMTLILSLLTQHEVIQVSDRRFYV
jgi:hypothetical protein